MPSDPVTRQLAAMLGQDVLDAEDIGDPTSPAAHPYTGVDGTAAPAGLQTGRGPTGRLRNFRAMNDNKLRTVATAVVAEDNDTEAVNAVMAEMQERGL